MSTRRIQSEQLKKANAMSTRQRRAWVTKVLDTQDAIDAAVEAQNKLLVQANEAGVSYETLGGALGIHASSIRQRIRSFLGTPKGES